MRCGALRLTVAALVLLAAGRAAGETVFVLTTGGRVTGELLNPEETPRQKFVIRAVGGARVTLEPSQVKQVLITRPEELQYEKIRPKYPDTVEGQWALAEWCFQQRLTAQREKHLRRVIELDPDHAEARRALGYSQLDGEWVTREEIMTRRGYQRYKGRWRTPQEIELLEKKRRVEIAEKEWAQKLGRWRDWLGTERDPQGRRNILAIDDPHAVEALTRNLTGDPSAHARTLYIEVLAKIGSPEAIEALAVCSIEDPVEEVRLTCLDYLEKKERPEVVAYYVGKLRAKDNRVVNLAAIGLGRMKDPSAVGPLIDALITVHKFKVSTGNPGSISTTFGTGPGGSGAPPGAGGLSVGGRPRIVSRYIRNRYVLDALIALTGQNFNFDERAWKYWYAGQQKRPNVDTRRD